jgi:uncharacterized protein involved in response to NO
MVKLAVLLLVAALVARRFLPRRRLPWAVPVLMAGVILTVRTVTWLTGDP